MPLERLWRLMAMLAFWWALRARLVLVGLYMPTSTMDLAGGMRIPQLWRVMLRQITVLERLFPLIISTIDLSLGLVVLEVLL